MQRMGHSNQEESMSNADRPGGQGSGSEGDPGAWQPQSRAQSWASSAAPGASESGYGRPPQYGQVPYGRPPQYGQVPYGQAPQYGQVPYGQAPYGQPPQYGQAAPGVAPKSMAVAIVLGILLGTFGVHNFYLGYVQKGVVQLALTLLGAATSWLLIGGVVVVAVFVWVVVDIVQIATRQGRYVVDANGLPLQ